MRRIKIIMVLAAVAAVLAGCARTEASPSVSESQELTNESEKMPSENDADGSGSSSASITGKEQESGSREKGNRKEEELEQEKGKTEADSGIPEETQGDAEETQTHSGAALPEDEEIERILQSLTLHEKVCQMMLVTPETLTGVGTVTAAGEVTKTSLQKNPVGGVILFSSNLESGEQVTQMLSNLQEYAQEINGIGVFIAVDEEGGRVARVSEKLGTTGFEPMYRYRSQGTQTAYDNAAVIAGDIAGFGFNLDFAPVADTWSNSENRVIGERAYSDDYEEAAKLVAAAVEGFHSQGVMCTLKHFPGHGDTAEDSHTGSAYSYKGLEALREEEFLPFRAGIDAGADMVMVGHITLPEIDSMPATLSEIIIKELLRGELGYDGVVITDSLSMKALTNTYEYGEIAVMAVKAGNDILLCQNGMDAMIQALEDAVNAGEISVERIDESVRRILRLKKAYGLL